MRQYNSLNDIRTDIANGQVTCRLLVEHYLQNIKEKAELNAFLETFDEEALAQADAVDQKIANGSAGKLAGMV